MEQQLESITPFAIAFVLAAIISVVGIYVIQELPTSGESDFSITTSGSTLFSQVNSSGTYTTTYYPINTGTFALKNSTGSAVNYYSLNITAGTFKVNASYTTATQTVNATENVVINLTYRPTAYPWNATGHSAANSSGGDITANATFNTTTGQVTFNANYTNAVVTYVYDKGTLAATATYTYEATSVASNASLDSSQGLETFVGFLPLLAVGVGAAVLIALLAGSLKGKDGL